jgi:hypothetical protein
MIPTMDKVDPPKAAQKIATSGKEEDDGERSDGPNLVLLYSLIALALAVAMGLAVLIVLPFYMRR